jgi:HlyD family secretion protein
MFIIYKKLYIGGNMRKVIFITALTIILISFVITGCARNTTSQQNETYIVAKQTVESTVNISGIVKYDPEISTISLVSGKVVHIYANEGDLVKAGDKIVEIDSVIARNNYESALNSYKIAKSNASIAKNTDLNNSLLQAQANLKSAEASYEIAKLNFSIAQKTDNSALQVNQAEEAVKTAEINVNNAELNLESLQKSNTSDESIKIAGFQVQNAQLSVALAELNLKNLKGSNTYEENLKVAEEQLGQARLNENSAQNKLDEVAKNTNTPDEEIKILENQLDIAKSNVRIAESNLEKTKNPLTPTEDQIQQAKYQADQANIALKIAVENYNQAVKAKEAKDIQVKTAQNQVEAAKSQLSTAKENLEMAKNNSSASSESLSIRKYQVETAEAALENAKATLSSTQIQIENNKIKIQQADYQTSQAYNSLQVALENLNNYTIKAPIGGTVILLNAREGDTISPGINIATIGNTGSFLAEGFADEIDAVNIKVEQPVTITFDSFQNVELQGKVKYVAMTKTMASQGILAYKVDVQIPETDLNLKSGLGVNFDILTNKKENVIAVPIESVLSENGKNYVDLIDENGKTQRVEVQTGISSSIYTEIISGLTEGQKILLVPAGSVFTNLNRGIFGGGQ